MTMLATKETVAPRRLPMTYKEYLDFAGDSQIVEWIDGEAIIYMPPTNTHQDVSRFLVTLLDGFSQFFGLGIVRYAPFEVRLGPDGPSREPDVIFISSNNQAGLSDKRFEGAPDLVVEIISPSSVTEDRVRKFEEFEAAGVREYWIIDPRPFQQQVDCYVLGEGRSAGSGRGGRYHPAPIDDEGVYHAAVLPDFWFKVDWLWQSPLPNPQRALAEIMLTVDRLPDDVKNAYGVIYRQLADGGQ